MVQPTATSTIPEKEINVSSQTSQTVPETKVGNKIGNENTIKKVETIKNPQQVVEITNRSIQTMRLKIERLEKHMADKLSQIKSPVFEKAKLKHIFGIDKIVKERASGNFETKYLGYHHDKGWKLIKKGKVEFLTEPKVCPKTGMITVNCLKIEGILVKDKTFFPPDWTRHKVIDKIIEASRNITKTKIEGGRQVLFGSTKEGINIKMVIDENKNLVTAFPTTEL